MLFFPHSYGMHRQISIRVLCSLSSPVLTHISLFFSSSNWQQTWRPLSDRMSLPRSSNIHSGEHAKMNDKHDQMVYLEMSVSSPIGDHERISERQTNRQRSRRKKKLEPRIFSDLSPFLSCAANIASIGSRSKCLGWERNRERERESRRKSTWIRPSLLRLFNLTTEFFWRMKTMPETPSSSLSKRRKSVHLSSSDRLSNRQHAIAIIIIFLRGKRREKESVTLTRERLPSENTCIYESVCLRDWIIKWSLFDHQKSVLGERSSPRL